MLNTKFAPHRITKVVWKMGKAKKFSSLYMTLNTCECFLNQNSRIWYKAHRCAIHDNEYYFLNIHVQYRTESKKLDRWMRSTRPLEPANSSSRIAEVSYEIMWFNKWLWYGFILPADSDHYINHEMNAKHRTHFTNAYYLHTMTGGQMQKKNIKFSMIFTHFSASYSTYSLAS